MSLHKFAQEVASKGRGDDSLLIHMTPDEVQRLQQFAQANGRSLTINPETGLPEAGMLSDLFKAVAPIALGAFLGPAGAAIGGGFMSAGMAGLAVGGITTLATGSLSRGLMAGLGAYGGAGLGESLMNAGTGALSQSAGAGLGEEAAQQAVASKLAAATPMETLTAGFNSATATPAAMGTFAKQNLGNIGYAASPILAGAMVPTTTKLDAPKNDNYIRQFDFNINPETGKPDPLYGVRSMAPVKANEWKDKTFQGQRDLFRQQNPNPYQLGVGSLNQAPQQQQIGMAGGGIVALAGGGDYTTLTKDSSADDIASAYKQAVAASGGDTEANQKVAIDYLTNLGIGQDKIGQAYGVYQASPTYTAYTDAEMGSFLSNPANKDINLDKAILDTNANPADVNRYIASLASPFVASTDTTGGSGTFGIYNQWNALGISPEEYYAAVIAHDPKYAGWSKTDIQRGYNLDKGALELSKSLEGTAADPVFGYDKQWVKFMDDNKYSIDDAAQAFGLSRNEVQRRYDAVKAAEKKVVTPITTVTGGAGTGGVNDLLLPSNPSTYAPPGTTNPYGNVNNPGDLTFNADGSTTVQPNIPGRPYGGFIGIQQLKDAYTKGGGSLGYTSKAPRTINEFNQLYNRQTGDSLAAYDYLMGKGSGKYPTKSGVPNIAENYAESVLGKKTVGLKPATVSGNTLTVGGVSYDLTDPTNPPPADTKGTWQWNVLNKRWIKISADGAVISSGYDGSGGVGGNSGGPSGGSDGAIGTGGMGAEGGDGAQSGGGPDNARGGLMPHGAYHMANGGMMGYAVGGGLGSLGSYSDGGRLLKGPGDGVSDSIPATIGRKQQPARLADGEFVIPARIVSELGNGSTDAGAKKLYAMMDRVQRARGKTTGKNKVAANSRSDKYLPA